MSACRGLLMSVIESRNGLVSENDVVHSSVVVALHGLDLLWLRCLLFIGQRRPIMNGKYLPSEQVREQFLPSLIQGRYTHNFNIATDYSRGSRHLRYAIAFCHIKFGVFWRSSSTDTLRIAGSSMSSLWHHYDDVVKQHWRSQWEISPEFPAF